MTRLQPNISGTVTAYHTTLSLEVVAYQCEHTASVVQAIAELVCRNMPVDERFESSLSSAFGIWNAHPTLTALSIPGIHLTSNAAAVRSCKLSFTATLTTSQPHSHEQFKYGRNDHTTPMTEAIAAAITKALG